ncbi:MAG: hypothetical protein K1X52_07280 [Pyrinomonadaceae bacterium]|nr:hypothetical protein [Pyrinomonadaceae bacterium]
MPAFERRLEVAANVAIIIAACFLGYAVLRGQFVHSEPAPFTKDGPKVGSAIQLDGVRLEHRNLIFALSTTCHFCAESMPFYSKLAATNGANHALKLIAVFPADAETGVKYLEGKGVQVDQVITTSFNKLGVEGTPTVILIDETGTILNRWVGKLPPSREAEIFALFGPSDSL